MATRVTYNPELVEEIASYVEQGDSFKVALTKAHISESVFYKWKQTHVEFEERLKRAEAKFREWEHSELLRSAKKSLKQLIEGYEYDEIENEYEADGKGGYVIKKQKSRTKKVAPNVTAVIFALVNRDPEHWQNRINGELTQKVEVEEKPNISLANVPDELLDQVIKLITQK